MLIRMAWWRSAWGSVAKLDSVWSPTALTCRKPDSQQRPAWLWQSDTSSPHRVFGFRRTRPRWVGQSTAEGYCSKQQAHKLVPYAVTGTPARQAELSQALQGRIALNQYAGVRCSPSVNPDLVQAEMLSKYSFAGDWKLDWGSDHETWRARQAHLSTKSQNNGAKPLARYGQPVCLEPVLVYLCPFLSRPRSPPWSTPHLCDAIPVAKGLRLTLEIDKARDHGEARGAFSSASVDSSKRTSG
ncbi:hypothetical protein BCV70DRAFT_89866 [Testicularia cyperi]|uniref:Uncharacterized protein n=1 Tax=Testicularia cyperi TaxID=1882483 RepID=A0A317XUX3_9BASI|nr:hypothetical protein BCV70DRAFT_89866 [Testicularia cyperi]